MSLLSMLWSSKGAPVIEPPPNLRPPRSTLPHVIVLDKPRLTEPEIIAALQGNEGAMWYKAIVSKIEQMREDNLQAGSRSASEGNPLAMAGALNTYEALSALLLELAAAVKKPKEG